MRGISGRKRFMGLALSLVLLLSACSSGGDKPADVPGDTQQPPATTQKPVPGGTLRVGVAVDPPSLDPQRDSGGPSSLVAESIFQTLLTWDENMELKGQLATEWTVAEDGLSITVKLRPGVTFHDGTPLDASAVEYTFKRALGEIGGRKSRYYSNMEVLDRVEVIDPMTVMFVMKEKNAPFITQLAYEATAILSPAAVEKYGEEFSRHAVGTGPFKLVDWQVDRQITLEKNDNYWDAEKPYLDKLEFHVIPNDNTRLVALESGQIDLDSQLPAEEIPRLKQDDKIKLYSAESLRTIFLMLNIETEPFTDIRVREAIIKAIDTKELNETVLEGQHRVALPTFAPGLLGVDGNLKPYEFDLARAKSLLDEAGWIAGANGIRTNNGKPLSIQLDSPNGRYPKDIQIAERLQAVLAEVGIQLEVKTGEWNAFRDKLIQKKSGFFLFGAGGSNGDLDGLAMILWHKGGTYGQGGTPADDLFEKGRTEMNVDQRLAIYREAQQKVRDNYQFFPLYYQNVYVAADPKVMGFKPHKLEKLVFTSVWLGE